MSTAVTTKSVEKREPTDATYRLLSETMRLKPQSLIAS
jgi:hypothetical protein